MHKHTTMKVTRKAHLYVGNRPATHVPPGEYGTDTDDVPSIRVVSVVDDPTMAYPHFVVEYETEETPQETQDDHMYDIFRIVPLGIEFGASRNVVAQCDTKHRRPTRQPPPGCVRALLYDSRLLVVGLPLKEYATTDGGRIRVVAAVHDVAYSADPYFFVEILQAPFEVGPPDAPPDTYGIRYRFNIK